MPPSAGFGLTPDRRLGKFNNIQSVGEMVETYPRRRSDLSVRVLAGEAVVLDRRAERIHQLNPTASYIWHRCDGMSTVAEIARQVTQAYDVDAGTAERDVLASIQQLNELGLLEQGK